MKTCVLVVAALLLTASAGSVAAAAENPEHPSKRALKTIAALNAMGINNSYINHLVIDIEEKRSTGEYRFREETVPGGKLILRYQYNSDSIVGPAQIAYRFNDSNVEGRAGVKGIAIEYKLKF